LAALSDVRTEVKVKDVMSTTVVTVRETDSVELAGQLMNKHDIGSVVVVDLNGKPVGIITERDAVGRVVAKNLQPRKVQAKTIMSAPIITTSPEMDINDAARRMSKLGIRRLVVMDRGKLIGIVTSKDILSITPELFNIITEKARITRSPLVTEGTPLVGQCDGCGQWSDSLRDADGKFLCEDCRAELQEG
jgi:CBS domain-containing protein